MLFFSYGYIFAFLPTVAVVYYLLNRWRLTDLGRAWLVAASLFFYAWWDVRYLPVLLSSILFNWAVSGAIHNRAGGGRHRAVLILGIAANVAFLGWFKYTDFVIANVNRVAETGIEPLHLVLPLAISFFTFQQIAYLVDSYKGLVPRRQFLNYALFVSFFPQLISGPIVHHSEMMPQFASLRNKLVQWDNVSRGLFVFTVGLAKKVLVADTFAVWANRGFDLARPLNVLEGWITSLSYTLQLYFDFSGYMDMALGAALLFNIKLPINFDSPNKAASIREFWRRWHVTLGRFLRQYVYIPLGGNRRGEARAHLNLMVTFLIGGLWHGAAWTFVLWGMLHGLALSVQRAWQLTGIRIPWIVGWFITFNFVNAARVFFRADAMDDVGRVLSAMVGLGAPLPLGATLAHMAPAEIVALGMIVGAIVVGTAVTVLAPNSHQLARRFTPTVPRALALGTALGAIALYVVIDSNRVTEFIYFRF